MYIYFIPIKGFATMRVLLSQSNEDDDDWEATDQTKLKKIPNAEFAATFTQNFN